MAKLWTWQGSQYESVTQLCQYAWICLNRFLKYLVGSTKYVRILNIAGFWTCKSYTGIQICHIMSEYVWIWYMNMPEYVSIYDNRQPGFWMCIIKYIAWRHSTSYGLLTEAYSVPGQRFWKNARFGKMIIVFNYFSKNPLS